MTVLGFALAALIGISLGIMGGGGSILTVPIFVYVLGFAAKPAIALSLPVVGATSAVGALGHWRAGNVDLRAAVLFGVIAMAGSYAGARLAVFVPGAVQLVILALVMLAAALAMFRRGGAVDPGDVPAQVPATGGGSPPVPPRAALPMGKLVPVALGVGALTGIVGIGGGFLVVPALVLLAGVPMKQAVGTSLVVIAMNSLSGFAGYLGQVSIPWGFLAAFTGVSIAGILAGTYAVGFISAGLLRRGFAVFLVVIGTFMLYQNRHVFRGEIGVPAVRHPERTPAVPGVTKPIP